MMLNELRVIDGSTLPEQEQHLLRPGQSWHVDEDTQPERLPRYFFQVPSWDAARSISLAPHFKLAELMTVDCRESHRLLHEFPHYVPCAVVLLALALENFRREVDAPVFISANGGYRSPAHQLSAKKNVHAWGTAADIYRIGSSWLNDEDSISKYARIAESVSPLARTKAYQPGADHLHFDLGFLTLVPNAASGD